MKIIKYKSLFFTYLTTTFLFIIVTIFHLILCVKTHLHLIEKSKHSLFSKLDSLSCDLFPVAERGRLGRNLLPSQPVTKLIHRKGDVLICHGCNQAQAEITSSTMNLWESLEQANTTINPCFLRTFNGSYSGLYEFELFLNMRFFPPWHSCKRTAYSEIQR